MKLRLLAFDITIFLPKVHNRLFYENIYVVSPKIIKTICITKQSLASGELQITYPDSVQNVNYGETSSLLEIPSYSPMGEELNGDTSFVLDAAPPAMRAQNHSKLTSPYATFSTCITCVQ